MFCVTLRIKRDFFHTVRIEFINTMYMNVRVSQLFPRVSLSVGRQGEFCINFWQENLNFILKQSHLSKAYWLRDAPTGLTFNNCTFCPHCIYVFCIYLRTNSDLSHLQHKLTGFYNRDEKCLLRGTNWVFN